MLELFQAHPWLIVVTLAMSIPILGIVFGTLTTYWTRVKLAEFEATLKQNMLDRGMSAEEIKMVIEARSGKGGKSSELVGR